jgi:aldehyde dehydrogenase (NAD+)
MGRTVGPHLAQRFARAILELGGNNAAVVCPSADLELALRAIAFAAIGTAGQRCTTLRRLFIHRHVYAALVERLKQVYATARVGNPLEDGSVLIGPLIDEAAFAAMQTTLSEVHALGGKITGGGRCHVERYPAAYYVQPALIEMAEQIGPVLRETFAPLLYVMPFTDFDQAIELHNGVPQGLASSIFSNDVREVEHFLSAAGSDCGIVNVNIGPSGAEIGGAFGGEKESGGGREAGSDAWKSYMRRVTSTINFGGELPLAQGVRFDIG